MKKKDRIEIYERFMDGFCAACLAKLWGVTIKAVENIIRKCGK